MRTGKFCLDTAGLNRMRPFIYRFGQGNRVWRFGRVIFLSFYFWPLYLTDFDYNICVRNIDINEEKKGGVLL